MKPELLKQLIELARLGFEHREAAELDTTEDVFVLSQAYEALKATGS